MARLAVGIQTSAVAPPHEWAGTAIVRSAQHG